MGPPVELQSITVSNPGELVDEIDVARFRLTGHEPGNPLFGQTGSYVDVGFADGFEPTSVDDTLEHRSKLVSAG